MNRNRNSQDSKHVSEDTKRVAKNKYKNKVAKQQRKDKGYSKEDADRFNDRKDLMSKPSRAANNNPAWYYTDSILMDQISRFPFTEFGGLSKPYGFELPSIMRLAYNPGPGVTYLPQLSTDKKSWESAAAEAQNKGINLAALKWWSLLVSTSGRGAQYTRNDVAILILALGEIISIYEFIRRAFGVLNAYSIRNRVLPQGLIEAMGIDYDDFAASIADYRLRMNTLIARINQLPIPNNIAYLAKCQDMYQHIYSDSNSPMAQFYVQVPASTWTLDEDSSSEGSILRTTAVVGVVADDADNAGFASLCKLTGTKNLSAYIDTLETMINKLIMSSTFSIIYSDLLRLSQQTSVNFWSFDSIDEKYVVVPEYNEMALTQIHNTTIMGSLSSQNFHEVLADLSGDKVPTRGITLNDVVCNADNDTVLYNPTFQGITFTYADTQDTNLSASLVDQPVGDLMYDSLSAEPTLDERIDGTRYLVTFSQNTYRRILSRTINTHTKHWYCNLILPDHWCMEATAFIQDSTAGKITLTEAASFCGQFMRGNYVINNLLKQSRWVSVFDWAPQIFMQSTSVDPNDLGLTATTSPIFDVNFVTKLDKAWLERVTDATFIGLFDVR